MSALKSGVDKLPSIPSLQQSLRQQVTTLNPSQHADTLQLQLTIKSVGAAVIDEDVLARELALFSKNLFHWSELEQGGADIVDVGDRLAFITFKTSELHAQHAQRVQQSRQALKDLVRLARLRASGCSLRRRAPADSPASPFAAQLRERPRPSSQGSGTTRQQARIVCRLAQREQQDARRRHRSHAIRARPARPGA